MRISPSRQRISSALAELLDEQSVLCEVEPSPGGDTHASFRIKLLSEDRTNKMLFVKVNQGVSQSILQSEYDSLVLINKSYQLHYPEPLGLVQDDHYAYLFLSYHELRPSSSSGHGLGVKLADALVAQHKITNENFGWPTNNHIGLTPQINDSQPDWPSFYVSCRLEPQLKRAMANGLPNRLVERIDQLVENIPQFFIHYTASPSLLHGDLWSGNVAYDLSSNKAMMFDPAPYFGDRECDLAFTELFGGFPQSFYRRYNQKFPLHDDYVSRKPVYNLYHALNHFNLFGVSYLGLVEMQLSEIFSSTA